MATLRELKGRIGSVASSEKITGAMKMISSAKMHKAEASLRRLVPYREQVTAIIRNLTGADVAISSPLCERHADIRNVALVVFGSDDGLCGAYNVNIAKRLFSRIAELRAAYGDNVGIDIYPVGKKMLKIVSRLNGATVRVRPTDAEVNTKSDGEAVKTFVGGVVNQYTGGNADKVECIYMKYHSAGRQTMTVDSILPVDRSSFDSDGAAKAASVRPYLFEPDAETIFRSVLPLYITSVACEMFAQNRASEQAARVMAMQSANDNAKKLLDQLQLEYNKLRQQSITTELLDIVGGQVRD